MNCTEEEVKRIEEWKKIAEEYNLSLFEMYQLAYHVLSIRQLIEKVKK